MLNIKLSNTSTYAEVGQINPLRWKTLFKEADGSFIDQSGWIKCKDFFNDTVAFFKEKSVFSIYGYKNDIKKNEEGVYMLLKFVSDKPSFIKNIEVVNKQLKQDLGCELSVQDHKDDELVILIPNELWETTYRISMVTMVIRLCNYGVTYSQWNDIWAEQSPVHNPEHAFTLDAKVNAQNLGFKVKPEFSKYWWFCGKEYNNETKPKQTGGTIHNNGVSNWSMYMKGV